MDYTIAGIRISIPEELITGAFGRALNPFDTTADNNSMPPALNLRRGITAGGGTSYCELDAFDFAEADADCRFGRDENGYLLTMTPRSGSPAARFRTLGMPEATDNTALENTAAELTKNCPAETLKVISDISAKHNPSLFRFGLWTMFNIAALRADAVAVHSSVIGCNGGAVLFLGESGTGKSTHTRLWREHISGAELINDDSPIVRIVNGEVRVYGSPWSGKTPCYRNISYPIRAIVRLSQSPQNRIRPLRPIEAIGALLPSCPPAFARDAQLQDAVCNLISGVLKRVPAYHLECLPDAEAAQLACKTIFGK